MLKRFPWNVKKKKNSARLTFWLTRLILFSEWVDDDNIKSSCLNKYSLSILRFHVGHVIDIGFKWAFFKHYPMTNVWPLRLSAWFWGFSGLRINQGKGQLVNGRPFQILGQREGKSGGLSYPEFDKGKATMTRKKKKKNTTQKHSNKT